MSEATFLSGKVIKRSLPVIQGRPGLEAPRLKRLLLAQGELAQVFDGEPGIRYLAYVELMKDAIRGNHFHEKKNEFIYIIAGRILLLVEELATRATARLEVCSGDLVFVPVRVAHGFRVIEPGHGMEFSIEPFDSGDSFPHHLNFSELGINKADGGNR